MNEHQLQVSVAEYLDAVLDPSVFWSSIGHGGGGKIRGAKLKKAGVKRGVPDLELIWPGEKRPNVGWIEFKAKEGRATPEQIATAQHLSKLGCYYAISHSLNDTIGILKAWGVPTREARWAA